MIAMPFLSLLDVVLFSIECDRLLDTMTNAIVYQYFNILFLKCQLLVNPMFLTLVVAEVKPRTRILASTAISKHSHWSMMSTRCFGVA